MNYKGIKGNYHYNKEMRCFVGELMNTEILVTFKGRTSKELKSNFIKAVNEYISMGLTSVEGRR